MSACGGICKFCGVTDAQIDGDKLSWFTPERDVCSKFDCRNRHFAAERERKAAAKRARPRRRTPADIHALIIQERAAKRKRARDAAKARGLLRSHGEGDAA